MKQASGISKIEYKIVGSAEIHEIPFQKEKAKCTANVEETKSGDVSKVKLNFRIIENPINEAFISTFIQNKRQLLLFKVYFHSGLVRIIGSSETRCKVEIDQQPGEKPGDFSGYIVDVNWTHKLFV